MLEAEQKLKAFRVTSCFDAYELVFLTGPDSKQVEALIELDRRLPAEIALVVTSPGIKLGPLVKGLQHGERVIGADLASRDVPNPPIDLQATGATAERPMARVFRWLAHAGYAVNAAELGMRHVAAA
jgi:hypothetical protein